MWLNLVRENKKISRMFRAAYHLTMGWRWWGGCSFPASSPLTAVCVAHLRGALINMRSAGQTVAAATCSCSAPFNCSWFRWASRWHWAARQSPRSLTYPLGGTEQNRTEKTRPEQNSRKVKPRSAAQIGSVCDHVPIIIIKCSSIHLPRIADIPAQPNAQRYFLGPTQPPAALWLWNAAQSHQERVDHKGCSGV